MARKRMLAPEFFTSRTIDEMSIQAAMGFAGLWCYVDDYGRGEDDLSLLKSAIWPRRRSITEAKIATDRARWVELRVVCRYEVSGFPLLHVESWLEHQKISHPTESKLPPCPRHDPALFAVFLRDSGGPLDKYRRDSGNAPERLHDSLGEVSRDKSSSGAAGIIRSLQERKASGT
jgi:hypothetical protein